MGSFPIGSGNGQLRAPSVYMPLWASFWDNDSGFSDRSSDKRNNSAQNDMEILKEIQERQMRDAILEDAFVSETTRSDSSSSLLSLSLVGQGKLALAARGSDSEEESNDPTENGPRKNRKNPRVTVLVLAPSGKSENSKDSTKYDPQPVLFLPLAAPIGSRMRLLSLVYEGKPISSFTNLIQWNLNLINRDGSLFDNIPWNRWTKDPDLKNRDSAGNFVDEKFRYGKRDAYNRFWGKDVNEKTVTASKRIYWEKKLKAWLDKGEGDTSSINDSKSNDTNTDEKDDDSGSSFSLPFLSKRVLELRIQELRMDIAELDSELAIARNNNMANEKDLEERRLEALQILQEAEKNLNDLLSSTPTSSSSASSGSTAEWDDATLFDKAARWAVDLSMNYRIEKNDAPYRGATGYAPRLSDTKDDSDVTLYRSPYDLLREILSDQLNAEVIGCVLENTSWLGGTLVLGGAVVLQRRTPVVKKNLMGEIIKMLDRDEDYGNAIKGGEIFVVECDADEAIGMGLSCDLPVLVEKSIFERSSTLGFQNNDDSDADLPEGAILIKDTRVKLPTWKPTDSGVSLHVEGNEVDGDAERLSPISMPRTTSSLFDGIFEQSSNPGGGATSSSSMFPTDNPIQSISQWDSLNNEGKAKTLLEMSNFSGRLPRPRTVRKAPFGDNPLDKILLPLIDESVRREYKIRDAEQRGDINLANELRATKSRRQKAKEKVDKARSEGNEDLANKWDQEAEFLDALRADVTQDEGAYSRFLDRDDWYERERQRTAKRVKKSSFGNLLDGIE